MDPEFAKHFFEEHWEAVLAGVGCLVGFLVWRWLAGKKADEKQDHENDQNTRCSHGVRTWRVCRKCAREFEREERAANPWIYKTTPKGKNWIYDEMKKWPLSDQRFFYNPNAAAADNSGFYREGGLQFKVGKPIEEVIWVDENGHIHIKLPQDNVHDVVFEGGVCRPRRVYRKVK